MHDYATLLQLHRVIVARGCHDGAVAASLFNGSQLTPQDHVSLALSETPEDLMQFSILGPVGMLTERQVCVPPLPKVRQSLALLLSNYNRTVGIESFIEELWDDNPPRSVMTTLQTYVYHLRKWLSSNQEMVPEKYQLITRPRGYALVGSNEGLDARIFERRLSEGRKSLIEGRSKEAERELRSALSLWHGEPFSNVTHGRILEARVVHLEEMKVEALQLRIAADMNLKRYRELIPVLRSAISDYPLDEWFYGVLMHSLNKAGRRAEALNLYQKLRRLLVSELGLEPSGALQRLHQLILASDEGAEGLPSQFLTDRWAS